MTSILDVIKRNNTIIEERTLSEIYGTEHFGYILYSLIRMQRPNNVIELGSGFGCVSTLIGQALKENNKGKVWCIDDQRDWDYLKSQLKKLGENYDSYDDFFNTLINKFNLKNWIQYKNHPIDFENKESFFDIKEPIDILFADISDSGQKGCVRLLQFYLSKMSEYSSIFIDRSSTLNHAYLTLEYIVDCFEKGKIPKILLEFKTQEEIEYLYNFIRRSKFTLIHLAESPDMKWHNFQNSTAWLKIEPLDIFIGNGVTNYT
jgi:hypothetical protein